MIGKRVRDAFYIHNEYEQELPERIQVAKNLLPDEFSYTIVKYNDKTNDVSFSFSPDFDESPEPFVKKSCKVSSDNKVSCREYKNNPPIYHGKYRFVAEDYDGFDVEESKKREQLWKSFPDIDYNRIGRKDYWEANVVPRIEARGYAPNDIKVACATGRKGGATSNNSVVTRYLMCSNLPKNTKILDFGAGYKAKQSQELSKKFSNVCAFDFQETVESSIAVEPELDKLFDDNALEKDHDIVIASNVINVQSSKDSLDRTLSDIYCNMKKGSTFIGNIPRDPIKYPATHSELVQIVTEKVEDRFGNKIKRVKSVCGDKTNSFLFKIDKTDDSSC